MNDGKVRVLILGASGIIGQHMRLCIPGWAEPIWHRSTGDELHVGCDFNDTPELACLLNLCNPQVIVNLAGANSPDKCSGQEAVNVSAVGVLAGWCNANNAHLVQVSSQAVFSGEHPPYGPKDELGPVNEYGRQKADAEHLARMAASHTILRPTFVLGVRPMPLIGRENPAEAMLAGKQPRQVSDRWFSPLFAPDAAMLIWEAVKNRPETEHLGCPLRVSRFDLARAFGVEVEPVRHEDFSGLAERPRDTSYSSASRYFSRFEHGIADIRRQWDDLQTLGKAARAREISLFTGVPEMSAYGDLVRGFNYHHAQVNNDFRRAKPATDDELLAWYRKTERYIWELSCYHVDPFFNYAGMCRGISERLKASGCRSVLCLGDGIGDLTLHLVRDGFDAVYHDLTDSRTAAFAEFRFRLYRPEPVRMVLTDGWTPEIQGRYDAVISLDFLEHVTDVPAWTAAIKSALVPGGLFFAQNAFGIGSGPDGSIPCHLARNDRFEKDWTPLLADLDFSQEGASNWWRAA